MMDQREFVEYIKEHIGGLLPGEAYGKGPRVVMRETVKSGNRKLQGLSIVKAGEAVLPVHYPELYYDDYRGGHTMAYIMEKIIRTDMEARANSPLPDILEDLWDFDAVRDRVYMQMCDTEESREYLQNRPHTENGDLSATYHILLKETGERTQGVGVLDWMMERWGVTTEELHTTAVGNIGEYEEPRLYEMIQMLEGRNKEERINYLEEGRELPEEYGAPMYILTNGKGEHGASCVMDPGLMEKVAEKTGRSFFILPSSRHEVILVPDEGAASYRELCGMVEEINQTQVLPEERLSNQVQYYDRGQKKALGKEGYREMQERKQARQKERSRARRLDSPKP